MDKEEDARWDEEIDKLICDYEEKTKEEKNTVITWDQSDGFKMYKPTQSQRPKNKEGPKEGTTSSILNKESDDPDVEGLEFEIQKLEEIVNVDTEEEDPTAAQSVDAESLTSGWLARQAHVTEKWKEARPEIKNTLLASKFPVRRLCQNCNRNAVIRCRECLPKQFLCSDCDMAVHKHFVLHNRDSVVDQIFNPICPSVRFVETAAGHYAIKKQDCLLPLDLPQTICSCSHSNIKMIPGKKVILINMNGCYKMYLPVLQCAACEYRWKVGLSDVIRSGYWPATVSFNTVYSVDVLSNFQNIKVTASDLSRLAFLHLIDNRTLEFGRTGSINRTTFQRSFLEWVNVCDEVNKLH
ncbi:hypothetical protein UPYG_G00018460 [Umbra pygmaea]|uniref:CxC3 like cysteine cluster domain-containing protein n=1 Tax=Umbra pygmaea TaxID=75934 RepID=A0ABD0Y9A4_UMBPY